MPDGTPRGGAPPQLYRALSAIFVGSGGALELLAFLRGKGVEATISLSSAGTSYVIELAPEADLDAVQWLLDEWLHEPLG